MSCFVLHAVVKLAVEQTKRLLQCGVAPHARSRAFALSPPLEATIITSGRNLRRQLNAIRLIDVHTITNHRAPKILRHCVQFFKQHHCWTMIAWL